MAKLDREEERVKAAYQSGDFELDEMRRKRAEIAARRAGLPSEPMPVRKVRQSLEIVGSLPAIFDAAAAAVDDPFRVEIVKRTNLLLRGILEVRFNEELLPVVVWRPPYDAILAAVVTPPALSVLEGGSAG